MKNCDNPLSYLSALAIEHQGTIKGKQIKKMYFHLLQAQLYEVSPVIKAFDKQEVLDMIYEGRLLEGTFDSKTGIIRLHDSEVERYLDRNSKEYLELYRGEHLTKAVRRSFCENNEPEYKYYVNGQRRREKQYQRAIVR